MRFGRRYTAPRQIFVSNAVVYVRIISLVEFRPFVCFAPRSQVSQTPSSCQFSHHGGVRYLCAAPHYAPSIILLRWPQGGQAVASTDGRSATWTARFRIPLSPFSVYRPLPCSYRSRSPCWVLVSSSPNGRWTSPVPPRSHRRRRRPHAVGFALDLSVHCGVPRRRPGRVPTPRHPLNCPTDHPLRGGSWSKNSDCCRQQHRTAHCCRATERRVPPRLTHQFKVVASPRYR